MILYSQAHTHVIISKSTKSYVIDFKQFKRVIYHLSKNKNI